MDPREREAEADVNQRTDALRLIPYDLDSRNEATDAIRRDGS